MARPGALADNINVTLNPAVAGCNLAPNSALMGDERACLVRIYDTAYFRGVLTPQGLFTLNLNQITLFTQGVNQPPTSNGLAGDSTTYRVKTLDEDGAPHSCLVWRATGLAVEVASPVMVLNPDGPIATTGLIAGDSPVEGGEEIVGILAKQVLEQTTLQMRRKNETCSYAFGNLIQFNGESDVFGYKSASNALPQLSWTREFGCCILFPAGTKNSKPLTLVLTPNPDVVGGDVTAYLGTGFYAAASSAALAGGYKSAPGTAAFVAGDNLAIGFAVRLAPLGFFDETIPNPGLCGPEALDESQLLALLRKNGILPQK